jgi:hypothetical protein
MRRLAAAALCLALMLPGAAQANVPTRFTVQGVLRDNTGALQTTTVTFVVRIWQSQTSMASQDLLFSYSPAPPNNVVMASNGLFTIAVALAPADVSAISTALANSSVTSLWLEVTANGYVYARQPLTEVMSSIFADALSPNCSGCVVDSMVNGVTASKISGALTNATIAGSAVTNGPSVTSGSAANVGAGGFRPNASSTVAHLTVNVPADGYLIVQANYTLEINDVLSGNGTACGVAVQLSTTATSPDATQPGSSTTVMPATIKTSDNTYVYRSSAGLNRVFKVNANPALPIYLQAGPYPVTCQNWDLDSITMTAYYVPAGNAANALSTP